MIYRLHLEDRTIDFYIKGCAELYLGMHNGAGWIEVLAVDKLSS